MGQKSSKKPGIKVESGNYKLAVVGSGGVGKSAIIIRYTQNRFVEGYDPTIEDYFKKTVTVDGGRVALDILDTAGQEEYASMLDQYIQSAEGFVLVFAITDSESFEKVKELREKIIKVKDKKNVPILILGNKADLQDQREVEKQEIQEYCTKIKCSYVETSAKTGNSIEEAFNALVREMNK